MKPYIKKFWKTAVPPSVWKRLLRTSIQLVSAEDNAKNGVMSMWWSIENLKKLGFQPRTILDVGAFKGEWTKRVKEIYPDASFLLVEAQPERAEEISTLVKDSPNLYFENSLVGAKSDDEVIFNVLKTGSSVFKQLHKTKTPGKTVTLTTKTLDTLVERNGLKGGYFIKLDVQGYELEVLKGAASVLKETEVVLMEASLLNYNEGAPLLHEVIAFMRDLKFLPFDICEMQRKSEDGVLNQIDIIFIHKDSRLRESVNFKKE